MATRQKLIHIHSKDQNTAKTGPKLPTADTIEYGEIAVNYLKDNETISFRNSSNEIVQVAMEKECNARYTALKKQLDELAQIYSIYGFARVNGDLSGVGEIFFGDYANMKELSSHIHMGLMKSDGSLYKRCANGRIDLASDGTELKIDGTDGDVMLFTNAKMYFLKATVDAPTDLGKTDGTKLNIIALGMSPFTIYGINAKGFNPFALTPQYTVNVDGVAHSVYNTNYKGEYKTPTASFNETFKASGAGYFSQFVNAMQSIWYAQGKNASQTTNRPFMGGYYEFFEIFISLMFLELKSVYHQDKASFGCGCTMSEVVTSATFGDLAMSGNSGVMCKVNTKGTTETKYFGLMNSGSINNTYPVGSLVGNSWYGFTEMLEPIRILSDVAKAGLVSKIWDGVTSDSANQSVVFTHDDDGNMVIATYTNSEGEEIVLTNKNLAAGTNMTANKKYYQIRNVPNCMGMSDGAMTAVVNIFVKMTFKEGISVNGASTTTVEGDYAVYKFSHPVYRGMCILDGMFKQMQGCHIVKENSGGTYTNRFIYADSYEDIPAQSAESIIYYGNIADTTPMEQGLNNSVIASQGNECIWAKDANYNASLFCYCNSGGEISTYESAYTWRDACYGNGDTSGTAETNNLPKDGRKCVNASVLGCSAYGASASVRSLSSNRAVSGGADVYAGAFALPELVL